LFTNKTTWMRGLALLSCALVLAACATRRDYTLVSAPADSRGVIERTLTQQPRKYRPEFVEVKNDYVEYGDGSSGKLADNGSIRSRHNVVRVYYDSVARNDLYQKGRWWIVRSFNAQGSLLASVWSDSEDQAVLYISALEAMKGKAVRSPNAPAAPTKPKAQEI
jgi:hypothetical protein